MTIKEFKINQRVFFDFGPDAYPCDVRGTGTIFGGFYREPPPTGAITEYIVFLDNPLQSGGYKGWKALLVPKEKIIDLTEAIKNKEYYDAVFNSLKELTSKNKE